MPNRLTRVEAQARTRSELLAAAGRVFARRGYDGASIVEIADEAGYSHGAVYSNFADKEDLFLALYEKWVAERVAEIDAEQDDRLTLGEWARAGAEGWVARVQRDPDAFLLRLEFTARAARDPDLRRKLSDRVAAVPSALRRLGARAAELSDREIGSVALDELALGLQALCLGLALEVLAQPDAVRPGVAGELAARLVDGLRLAPEKAR